MIQVLDMISLCARAAHGKCYARSTNKHMAVVHRISLAKDKHRQYGLSSIPDADLTGFALADRFSDTRKFRPGSYTGGQHPYHVLVRTDGVVEQCLPLTVIAPHARGHNMHAIAIALAGDFRSRAPTPQQWHTLTQLAGVCMAAGMTVSGHDELDGASADAKKECPGRYLDMADLRTEAAAVAEDVGDVDHGVLVEMGFRWA